MQIGGFQKFSLIDFPGLTSAVVFTQGCNFRCPYCHNPELVLPERFGETFPALDILDFLAKRTGKLQGVAITGGEATLQRDLPDFLMAVKSLGFKTKLDTNGSKPQVLSDVLSARLVDFVAMDVKAPLKHYNQLAGCRVKIQAIEESIRIILNSGLSYQFRTTTSRLLHTPEMFEEIMHWMEKLGANHIFQNFTPNKTLYPLLQ